MNKMKTVDETLAELREHYHLTGTERQPKQLNTSDFDGPVIFSNDPKTATVPPAFFTVQTIQEMKELGGVPDSEYGPGGMEPNHPLPEPYSAERLANVTGNHADICKAFRAYIYGYSPLVKDYEDILNAKRFPMKVALYSGEDIVVTADHPLYVGDPNSHGEAVTVNYGKVIIEPGGQIIYLTNGTLNADEIIVNAPTTPRDDQSQDIVNQGGDGGNGGDGSDGRSGGNGSNGSAGEDNKSSCARPATAGTSGVNGTSGADGGDGAGGHTANDITINATSLNGVINMLTQGGKGGNGGNGGKGGNGGNGGNGGGSTSHCGAGKGGNGGNGGDGGKAGNGGKGGDGGKIYVTYKNGNPTINAKALGGNGGNSGYAGSGGTGGSSGSGSPSGNTGQNGKSGGTGSAGLAGSVGEIFINGKKQ
ncbi:hypothetical protein [Photorhabdus tasmaniensis]|uniref:Hint domain-containing protein n=1 Tax=Photorhabdus tasmaniensis TaxID=1004159 RepID=A0ABX0GKU9_9GAMM|nr:hypothetical protein [Photorhabdus tasmaniensis]NHB89758.1 hypothetical protein [Photorhabdus tasmaniensis]